MKEKILQQISNKYKGSSETTMNNYTPANWTNKKGDTLLDQLELAHTVDRV